MGRTNHASTPHYPADWGFLPIMLKQAEAVVPPATSKAPREVHPSTHKVSTKRLFHERVQQSSESVDSYAQELKKLYVRAYPKLAREESEEGRMMLASRFVARLKPKLQEKWTRLRGELRGATLTSKIRGSEAPRTVDR